MVVERTVRGLDRRLGLARFARTELNKVFPDHWSFMIGEIAMYCLVVLIVTGVYLTFFFVPARSCTTAATNRCVAYECRRRTSRRCTCRSTCAPAC